MHFSFLWSFFEAEALNTRASSCSIRELVYGWAAQNRLNSMGFSNSLIYFKNRYFNGGKPTPLFRGLNLSQNDRPYVEEVLSGENTDDAHCVAELLIVVYRLRNNFFHGVKWGDGFGNQLNNFTNANDAIMAALETHRNP